MLNTEKILRQGKEMKLFRRLMGIKQCDMAAQLKTSQGNYSKMESGRENPGWRYAAVRNIFNDWRQYEINRLNNQIEYLNEL